MDRTCRAASLGVVLALALLSGCGREKAAALEEIAKINAACEARDRQKAYDIMVAAADNNETFGKSFRDVTSNVPDKTVIDACGTVMERVQRHIEAH